MAKNEVVDIVLLDRTGLTTRVGLTYEPEIVSSGRGTASQQG